MTAAPDRPAPPTPSAPPPSAPPHQPLIIAALCPQPPRSLNSLMTGGSGSARRRVTPGCPPRCQMAAEAERRRPRCPSAFKSREASPYRPLFLVPPHWPFQRRHVSGRSRGISRSRGGWPAAGRAAGPWGLRDPGAPPGPCWLAGPAGSGWGGVRGEALPLPALGEPLRQRRKWPRGGLAASGVGGAGGAAAASPTPAGAGRGGRSRAPRSPPSRRRPPRKRAEGHGGRPAAGARARPSLGRPVGPTPPPRSGPAAGPGRGAEEARDCCSTAGAGPSKRRRPRAPSPGGPRAGRCRGCALLVVLVCFSFPRAFWLRSAKQRLEVNLRALMLLLFQSPCILVMYFCSCYF